MDIMGKEQHRHMGKPIATLREKGYVRAADQDSMTTVVAGIGSGGD
jgi:hypothetical protein